MPNPLPRIGFGQDSHAFSKDPNKKLILGGVEIQDEIGLEGNSDGDVIAHALCSAFEQALGNNFFSVYTDKMCKEDGIIDGREYLKVALTHLREKNYQIANIGISLECQKPKILPYREKITQSLAETLQINPDQIGINATSGEGLTAFGQGQGIQVFAIVNLIPIYHAEVLT